MHKVTFNYNKRKERFVVSNTSEHSVRVLIPGIEVDEVQVTSASPFKVEIHRGGDNQSLPNIISSKHISTSE